MRSEYFYKFLCTKRVKSMNETVAGRAVCLYVCMYVVVRSDPKTGLRLFQAELPLFDEFLGKSYKLQTQLKATNTVFSSFLDTFQKIADAASNTKGP